MSRNKGLIYFEDGELLAKSNDVKVYKMNNELFLEIGKGHTLWALESEIFDYMNQIGDKPNGDVLEIGLGLGVMSRYLLTFPKVNSVTTVEQNMDVIRVHEQIYDHLYTKDYKKIIKNKKHIVLHIDGLSYLYATEFKYDFIFLDFYDRIDEDTLPLIKDMANGCKKVLKENGLVYAWLDPYTPEEFMEEFNSIFPIKAK